MKDFDLVAKLYFDISTIADGCGIENETLLKSVFMMGSGTYKIYQLKLAQALGMDVLEGFDLYNYKDNCKYAVRMMHKDGVMLSKSISVGGKRTFDEAIFFKYLDGIKGYFIIDTETFPYTNTYFISSMTVAYLWNINIINNNGLLTRKRFNSLSKIDLL